jgi:hypothetical protein
MNELDVLLGADGVVVEEEDGDPLDSGRGHRRPYNAFSRLGHINPCPDPENRSKGLLRAKKGRNNA